MLTSFAITTRIAIIFVLFLYSKAMQPHKQERLKAWFWTDLMYWKVLSYNPKQSNNWHAYYNCTGCSLGLDLTLLQIFHDSEQFCFLHLLCIFRLSHIVCYSSSLTKTADMHIVLSKRVQFCKLCMKTPLYFVQLRNNYTLDCVHWEMTLMYTALVKHRHYNCCITSL